MITREHDQYVLRSRTTGAVIGRHPSKAAAKRQEVAVRAAQHADASDVSRLQQHLSRAQLTARSRARRKPKAVKPAPLPNGIVIEYTRRLLAISTAMDELINRALMGHGVFPHETDLEADPHVIVPVTPGPVPTNDARGATRLDAPPADGAPGQSPPPVPAGLAAALRQMERQLRELTGARKLTAGVDEIATRTAGHSLTQWRAQVQQSLGISIANDVHIAPLVDGFRQRNLDLIVSLAADKVARVRDVFEGNPGARVETLARRIQDESGATASRAALIARDQVLKFNSQVTREQHLAAGVTAYEWSTSQDERVRDSHAALDGQIIQYDDPPVVDEKTGRTAHAGDDFQCRCVQVPQLPDFDTEAPPGAPVPDESADEEPPPEEAPPPVTPPAVDAQAEHDRHVEELRASVEANRAAQAAALAEARRVREAAQAEAERVHRAEIERLTNRIAETKAKIAAEDRARDRTIPRRAKPPTPPPTPAPAASARRPLPAGRLPTNADYPDAGTALRPGALLEQSRADMESLTAATRNAAGGFVRERVHQEINFIREAGGVDAAIARVRKAGVRGRELAARIESIRGAQSVSDRIPRIFDEAPARPGTVFRGIGPLNQQQLDAIVNTDAIEMQRVSSTSRHPDVTHDFMSRPEHRDPNLALFPEEESRRQALRGDVMLVLHHRSGVGIEALGAHNEAEVLLNAGTRFRVLNRQMILRDGWPTWVVEAEEI